MMIMLEGEKLGKALDKARRIKGLSKRELASNLGVSIKEIKAWIVTGLIKPPQASDLIDYFSDTVGLKHWESAHIIKDNLSKYEATRNINAIEDNKPQSPLTSFSVSCREDDKWKLQDIAEANRKRKSGPKTVSALVLASLRETGLLP